jgi:hypothetical protein
MLPSSEKDSESKAEKTVNQEKKGGEDMSFSLEPAGYTGSHYLGRTYCQLFYVAVDNNKFLHNFDSHLSHSTVSLHNRRPRFTSSLPLYPRERAPLHKAGLDVAFTGIRTPDSPASSVVAISTTLPRLLTQRQCVRKITLVAII